MQQLQPPTSFREMSKNAEGPLALVIDNQPVIRDMLSWMLHLQGYQSTGIMNGQAALDWMDNAQHMEKYPTVILLDLLMPVTNGINFLANLRAHWSAPTPLPPIILLTVIRSNYDFLECSNVLVKPFHFTDLCECLRLATNISSPNVVDI